MKYRKKPVVIEAIRIDTETEGELSPNSMSHAVIAGWMMGNGFRDFRVIGEQAPFGLLIKTLEGDMVADPGDYIIKGVQGEFYPCKPDIFESTYTPEPEEDDPYPTQWVILVCRTCGKLAEFPFCKHRNEPRAETEKWFTEVLVSGVVPTEART